MAPGDRITLNGYKFIETMHGPMWWGVCVDCGKPALEAVSYDGPTETRCDRCGRSHHGALLTYYRTGRTALYRRVQSPELDRLRAIANAKWRKEQ